MVPWGGLVCADSSRWLLSGPETSARLSSVRACAGAICQARERDTDQLTAFFVADLSYLSRSLYSLYVSLPPRPPLLPLLIVTAVNFKRCGVLIRKSSSSDKAPRISPHPTSLVSLVFLPIRTRLLYLAAGLSVAELVLTLLHAIGLISCLHIDWHVLGIG